MSLEKTSKLQIFLRNARAALTFFAVDLPQVGFSLHAEEMPILLLVSVKTPSKTKSMDNERVFVSG